jgi:hypothetical protein
MSFFKGDLRSALFTVVSALSAAGIGESGDGVLEKKTSVKLYNSPTHSGEPGYGIDLFEDSYLFLLPAADLRMDPALRPRLVSLVAFAYLCNTPQLDRSIERRYI